MPDCSIIIRAYNESKHLGRLLEGIRSQTIASPQVILVDSGSTDDTVKIAEKNHAHVVHIQPDEFSFGRSLNLGIERAQSEFLVICSAHVYPVYPDWLEKLITPLQDQKTALTYGKQRGTKKSHFSEQQIFHSWYPDSSINKQAHPFCNNANAALKRSFWEGHRYNETIPALEDLDWAKWAHDQGYIIRYIAEAEVVHVHHESWAGITNRYRREAIAFKQLYPQERFGIWDMLFMFWQNSISDIRYSKEQGVHAKTSDILRFRWSQFHGTYQGYRQSGPLSWKLKQTFYYPQIQAREDRRNDFRDVKPISYEPKE